jgi:hypothetical protein
MRIMIGLAIVAVAVCGHPAVPAGGGGSVDVAELVGSWSVSGTGTVGAVLVLESTRFELRSGSDVRYGGWRADSSGLFVAHVTGAGGDAPPDMSTPQWLEAATAVTRAGSHLLLLDAAGEATAHLSPQGGPPPGAAGPAGHFGPAAPLPTGLEPPERSRLVGRWEITDREQAARAPQPPHVDLAAEGSWTGSDGCNVGAGRWVSGPHGMLLATSGPMTLKGCEGMAGVPGWLASTVRAGFDGETLVLFDVDGRELGRLIRP